MHLFHALLPLLAYATLVGCMTAAPSDQARTTAPASAAVCAEELALSPFFQGIEGTFVLLDPQTGHIVCHNPQRARRRFLPASTYKIPHTLIALETGVANGPDFPLPWDHSIVPQQPWWPEVWTRGHTLRTALPNSVVWYYQELARRIGHTRMQGYLEQFEYGNRDLSGGIDQFWLTGGLRISPAEQVAFLRRFYVGELGVSEHTTRIAKDLLVLEDTPAYRLSGKTGWAGLGDSSAPQVGWLVGYVERDGRVHLFATNIDMKIREDAAARLSITRAILRDREWLSD